MRRSIPTIAALAVMVCIVGFLWRRQAATTAALTALHQQSEELRSQLESRDPSKALATASLKPYWPFFESLREREHTMFLMEKLQAGLLQAQLEARAAAEKAKTQ